MENPLHKITSDTELCFKSITHEVETLTLKLDQMGQTCLDPQINPSSQSSEFQMLFDGIQKSLKSILLALKKISDQKVNLEELVYKSTQLTQKAAIGEISSEVLHNVGNCFSSLSLSISTLGDLVLENRSEKMNNLLEKILPFLNKEATQENQLIVKYFQKLTDHFQKKDKFLQEELFSLKEQCAHIKSVIYTQQSLSKQKFAVEKININNVIEEVLRLSFNQLQRHDIQLDKKYQSLPPCVIDKHKFISVLLNLLKNARDALLLHKHSNRKLKIETRVDRQQKNIIVIIHDNGVGISKEAQRNIFEHGFTTKDEGHGFGLHSSMTLIKQMKGEMFFSSPGENKGATFKISLPIR